MDNNNSSDNLDTPSEQQPPYEVIYHVCQEGKRPDNVGILVKGIRLSLLRKLLPGDEGYITDMDHNRYHISLKPWADADPETASLHPVQVLTNAEEPGIHMEQKK